MRKHLSARLFAVGMVFVLAALVVATTGALAAPVDEQALTIWPAVAGWDIGVVLLIIGIVAIAAGIIVALGAKGNKMRAGLAVLGVGVFLFLTSVVGMLVTIPAAQVEEPTAVFEAAFAGASAAVAVDAELASTTVQWADAKQKSMRLLDNATNFATQTDSYIFNATISWNPLEAESTDIASTALDLGVVQTVPGTTGDVAILNKDTQTQAFDVTYSGTGVQLRAGTEYVISLSPGDAISLTITVDIRDAVWDDNSITSGTYEFELLIGGNTLVVEFFIEAA